MAGIISFHTVPDHSFYAVFRLQRFLVHIVKGLHLHTIIDKDTYRCTDHYHKYQNTDPGCLCFAERNLLHFLGSR